MHVLSEFQLAHLLARHGTRRRARGNTLPSTKSDGSISRSASGSAIVIAIATESARFLERVKGDTVALLERAARRDAGDERRVCMAAIFGNAQQQGKTRTARQAQFSPFFVTSSSQKSSQQSKQHIEESKLHDAKG